jgi:hypothetical protein
MLSVATFLHISDFFEHSYKCPLQGEVTARARESSEHLQLWGNHTKRGKKKRWYINEFSTRTSVRPPHVNHIVPCSALAVRFTTVNRGSK